MLWLAVAGRDAERAMRALSAHMDEEFARHLPVGVDAPDAAPTLDLDADGSACPACGEALAAGATRCTGCGLRFG